jgi:hypothetical protein
MASKWSQIQSFGNETCIEHKVAEQSVRFWPVSVKLLLELRGLIQPLSNSIAVLTTSNAQDTSQTFREIGDPARDTDGAVFTLNGRTIRNTETVSEAISPALAKYREEQRAKAIKDLIDAATDPKNLEKIGAVIIDSIRRGDFFSEVPTANQFMESMSPDILIQFLTGVAKANAGVFGPLAGRFEEIKQTLKSRVNLEPKTTPTSETPDEHGETSPIRLSGSPSEDTPSDG